MKLGAKRIIISKNRIYTSLGLITFINFIPALVNYNCTNIFFTNSFRLIVKWSPLRFRLKVNCPNNPL